MSDDGNAYQRFGLIEIAPLLERFEVPCTSACSPIDRQIMLEDFLSGEAEALHVNCNDLIAQAEEARDDEKSKREGLQEELEAVRKDLRAEIAKLANERDAALAQVENFKVASANLVTLVDMMAERDAAVAVLATEQATIASLIGYLRKKAPKTLAKWQESRKSEQGGKK